MLSERHCSDKAAVPVPRCPAFAALPAASSVLPGRPLILPSAFLQNATSATWRGSTAPSPCVACFACFACAAWRSAVPSLRVSRRDSSCRRALPPPTAAASFGRSPATHPCQPVRGGIRQKSSSGIVGMTVELASSECGARLMMGMTCALKRSRK